MATVGQASAVGLQRVTARFVENGAGTYTADFILPAGTEIYDIVVTSEALWTAATSAALIVGEVADPDGFYASIDLKATDLLATQSISMNSTQVRGGNTGAYLTVGTSTHVGPRFSASERTITASITSVGAGTAGRTRVTVIFYGPQFTEITQ
jgi:hypothetical protein